MSTAELLKLEIRDRVGIITLNRSEARNALNSPMLHLLDAALLACENDLKTRVVIITGGKDFCAGADLRELNQMNPVEAENFSRLGHAVFQRIETLSKVVVAAVSGYALGGGCELALACDIRLAGESAHFGLPEVNLGLIPGFGGTQRLPALIGLTRAREMILSGRVIAAREAAAIGLVSMVVSDQDLPAEVEDLAARISGKSPVALRTVKRLMREICRFDEGLKQEAAAFAKCFDSPDRREGIAAFLEKRHPVFSD